MLLDLIIVGGIAAHIYIPSIWFPIWYIGPLAIYIISKQYMRTILWIVVISVVLTQTSLTVWWVNILYYGIWSLGVYLFSTSFDRGWAVQTVLSSAWLLVSLLIVFGLSIPLNQIAIFIGVNVLWIAISLQIADKYKIYEQIG